MNKVKELRVTVRQFLTKPSENPKFADRKPVPMRTMFGYVIEERGNSVKVALMGKPEPSSVCLHCGRTLNHPVSVLYGIGPICGQHFHINPFDTEEELKAQMEELKEKLAAVTWEGWLPRGHIEMEETGNEIEPFGTKVEEPKAEYKAVYEGLSREQDELVVKSWMNHLDNPRKPKPVEIWLDKKGIVKLVFIKNDGNKTCYKIDREGNTPMMTGLPFAPKYTKKHEISYEEQKAVKTEVEVTEKAKEVAKKVLETPKVDEELVTALAAELNSLFI
jgi:hypothetical protein